MIYVVSKFGSLKKHTMAKWQARWNLVNIKFIKNIK